MFYLVPVTLPSTYFYDHWVGNKDSVRPKAFEAIVDTFARPDAIKASFG